MVSSTETKIFNFEEKKYENKELENIEDEKLCLKFLYNN